MTALDIRASETFPSRRDEAWKYSDLRRHLRAAPAPSPEGATPGPGPFDAMDGEVMAFVNGQALGAADFIASGEKTLRLRHVSQADGTGHVSSVRIAVRPGARLLLLESHEGAGSAYVVHDRLELDLAEGAEVERIVLADEAADAIAIREADVNVAPGARYRQTLIAMGARLQRLETRIAYGGEGAQVRADGLYLLDGARHADLTSAVTHTGPGGQTSQLVKGVARDASRGVFQGRIVVERGADGTDARMGHHALIAGERAEIDAKPELIIYADEVQCAHGNTVGNLDENALFYMQQRGIPVEEARALLTQAFLFEGVDRIEHEGAREVVRAWLTARL